MSPLSPSSMPVERASSSLHGGHSRKPLRFVQDFLS